MLKCTHWRNRGNKAIVPMTKVVFPHRVHKHHAHAIYSIIINKKFNTFANTCTAYKKTSYLISTPTQINFKKFSSLYIATLTTMQILHTLRINL